MMHPWPFDPSVFRVVGGLVVQTSKMCWRHPRPQHLHHWPFQAVILVLKAKANIQWFISFGCSSTSSERSRSALGKDKATAWTLGRCCECPPSSALSHFHIATLRRETLNTAQHSTGISIKWSLLAFSMSTLHNRILEHGQTHRLSHIKK